MSDTAIEQAIFVRQETGEGRISARSPGFRDEWSPDVERLCDNFGLPPAGTQCPPCVFAYRLNKDHVAVVQVGDLGSVETLLPGPVGFRLMVIPRLFYEQCIGDPFLVADRFQPQWKARDPLSSLTWSADPIPNRKVEEIRKILRPMDGSPEKVLSQAATLLGGAQALVDGGRLVFERSVPDSDIVRNLWLLLPSSTRCKLWPATFTFGNSLPFDVVVVPRARGESFAGYLTEDQAGDYPEGRYELNLQMAVEAGDQRELDRLFARRSSAQTFRLGRIILGFAILLVLGVKLLNAKIFSPEAGSPPPATKSSPTD
jgi:hypothetical protein